MRYTALTQYAGGHSELSSTAAHIAGYALSLCGLWATPGVVSLVWEGAAFPWTTAPVQGAGLGCARL